MNSERIFNIIKMDISSNILILEEELERTINMDLETNQKINKIKTLLNKIVVFEATLSKFEKMIKKDKKSD